MRTEARRKGAAFDEVWVVVEVPSMDEHDALTSLSAGDQVRIARISPCFERWPLSHLIDADPEVALATEHRLRAEALLPRLHDALGLDRTFDPLLGRFSDAKNRSGECGTSELVSLVSAIELSWRRFAGETTSVI